ncbi:MAG: hypothetical protein AAF809_11970, partial [Bacteroidota bacterium]
LGGILGVHPALVHGDLERVEFVLLGRSEALPREFRSALIDLPHGDIKGWMGEGYGGISRSPMIESSPDSIKQARSDLLPERH